MKRSEIFFGLIKIPTDFVMVVLAFLLSYKLRIITDNLKGFANPIDYSVLPTIKEYFNFSAYAALALIAVFAIGRMYTLKSTFHFSKEFKRTILLTLVWVMLIITYFFFTRTFPFSRLAILYSFSLAGMMLITGRAVIKILQKIALRLGIGQKRVLLFGENSVSKELVQKLSKDSSFKILDTIDSIARLPYITEKLKVEEIIQTKSENSQQVLEFCEENHIEYTFVPDLMEVKRTNVEVKAVGSIPLITLKKTPLDGWGKVAKRTMDIIGAVIGLILLSPIFLITAIAIKIDSRGPVLFKKLDNGTPVKRVGQFGKLFKCYKFRSMHPNTDSLRYTEEFLNKNLRSDGPLVKIKDDPRVTKVGRFIRKYSIDELPQLWNVLIGNMSLVGPRPHLPEEVAHYKGSHKFVLTIKPGMTGLPQISGRSDLDFENEVKLDRYYIENWSLWLDTKLIFKTVGILLKGYKE
jgi:exopolysaccharide biosynthesis polyprenyl glycosylphosphotransferase